MCDHGFLVCDPDDQGNVFHCKMCDERFIDDPTGVPPTGKIPIPSEISLSKVEIEELVRQMSQPLIVNDYHKAIDAIMTVQPISPSASAHKYWSQK